jgi:hypothetical protein
LSLVVAVVVAAVAVALIVTIIVVGTTAVVDVVIPYMPLEQKQNYISIICLYLKIQCGQYLDRRHVQIVKILKAL